MGLRILLDLEVIGFLVNLDTMRIVNHKVVVSL